MTKFEKAAKAERTDKYDHGYMPFYEQALQDLQCSSILELDKLLCVRFAQEALS